MRDNYATPKADFLKVEEPVSATARLGYCIPQWHVGLSLADNWERGPDYMLNLDCKHLQCVETYFLGQLNHARLVDKRLCWYSLPLIGFILDVFSNQRAKPLRQEQEMRYLLRNLG